MNRNAFVRARCARASSTLHARLGALALIVSLPCAAGGVVPEFTLLPASPSAGEMVVLREEVPAGSVSFNPRVSVSPGRIVVVFEQPDISGPFPAQTLTYPVGALAPGLYQVDYIGCTNPPPPNPSCELRGSEPFVVRGTTAATSVPATGPLALAALSLALLATFFLRSRRERLQPGPRP